MSETIRWGIIGCGRIAAAFAEGLKPLPDGRLAAAASQTREKAEAFCEKFSVKVCHGSYEALVEDHGVDVVYIATPHRFHFDHALLALEHGKHVLCEKAFTLNASQAQVLIHSARERKLFLMEAMWTRFLPCTQRLLEFLGGGGIGEIRMVKADLCKIFPRDLEDRFFNRELGGGSLLDLGVYGISFARFVYGQAPSDIQGAALIGDSGVDEQTAILLTHEGGRHAILSSSLITALPPDMFIAGDEGYIHVPNFTRPARFQIHRAGKEPEIVEVPYESTGLNYEAAEVMRCIQAGKIESDLLPLRSTLENMKVMDRIRSLWDLTYPGE
jgi:predicted dehydrogenase